MSSNLDKYKKDIERLISDGVMLELAMELSYSSEQFDAAYMDVHNDEKKLLEFKKKIPSFRDEYQIWYSEARALLKQLLPDRVQDFAKLYEKPKGTRKTITSENYVIEDALQGLEIIGNYSKSKIVGFDAAMPRLKQQVSIVKSVRKRFESSLFDIRQLVRADLFDSEIDIAKELNKKGFARAAGAVAGVVLEGHLLQVCENHRIKILKKNPTMNDLSELLKESEVIEIPEWRKLQHLADVRNLCDHKKKTEPSKDDISELLAGVSKVIKNLF